MTAETRGLSWDENEKRGKTTSLFAVLALIASLFAAGFAPSPAVASGNVDVIVRETNPATTTAETLIERLGGTVRDHLTLIGGFTATIPAGALDLVATNPAIESAVTDDSVQLLSWADESPDERLPGSMDVITSSVIRAVDFWQAGYTGAGVDVALIDSGVVPVDGLTTPGKIVNGPDLSLEQVDAVRYLDTYGHGTHMAGIIAGRSEGADLGNYRSTCCYLLGANGSLNQVNPFDFDPATNLTTIGTSATAVYAMATQPGTETLFASKGSSLATMTPTSAALTTIGSFGSAVGPKGSVNIDNVTALTFYGNRLIGVQDMGSAQDLLLEVDPATGKVVKGVFGGADYIEIQKPSATLKSLADIAVDPMSGTMYGLAWDGNGRYELATVDATTGQVVLLGGKLGRKVDTIAFDGYGELWGFDREKSELVVLDKLAGDKPGGARKVTISTQIVDIAPTTADVFNTPSPDFLGVAPDARIVNVKVGANDGSVDVSQVIAAIDWVVQHKNDNGLNIRVLNLSFGTDSKQKYNADPLSYAVEQAWSHGIVVVVSAGNDGNGAEVRNPAFNPFVITVGAVDTAGTYGVGDDTLSSFSNCGSARHPDLMAPGKSIVSLRTPGSTSDEFHPSARVGTRLFRGTGTSQAAAVVSGAAALLIDQRPDLTPDEVKAILTGSARTLPGVNSNCQGAGLVDLSNALTMATPKAAQSFKVSKGNGSLDAARGSHRLKVDGAIISGEVDIHGKPWTGASTGTSWSGGTWNGTSWSGTSWSGTSWSGVSWSGVSWSGTSWSGVSWSGTSWSGVSWSGVSWSGTSWSGTSWSGTSWSGSSWSDESWTGGSWG